MVHGMIEFLAGDSFMNKADQQWPECVLRRIVIHIDGLIVSSFDV